MTRTHRIVVASGLLAILVMALFPPWIETYTRPGMAPSQRPAGYAAVWDPPDVDGSPTRFGSRLDLARLAVQVMGVVAGTAVLVLLMRRNVVDT